MKGLLIHKDGGLKTGRVALLIFVLLLAGSGFLFSAGRQLDTALVAVQHVFEPQPVEAVEKEALAESVAVVNDQAVKEAEAKHTESPAPADAPVSGELPVAAEVSQQQTAPKAELTPAAEPEVEVQVKKPAPQIQTVAEPEPLRKKVSEQTPVAEPLVIQERQTSTAELSVAPDRYLELLQSWNNSGSEEVRSAPIPLRVENLRQSFALFQMKVVAVNVRGQMFDLADGSRLPSAALDDYSATVFVVENPWPQWGDALKSAKFRSGEPVQVRYAMYPFVKNAIYARSRQAFEWCKASGHIAADTRPEQVDVLGRTFVINRKGGGRFGVFVPVSLIAQDGRTIAISCEAFAGQADVEALRQAGMM